MLSWSIWFHLLWGTGFWHRWTFGLIWSSFSGTFHCFIFYFPCYKTHDAAGSANMYLSLANSLNTGANKRREGHENSLCSSFQICGAVPRNCKTSWFYLPGICWERGGILKEQLCNISKRFQTLVWTIFSTALRSGMTPSTGPRPSARQQVSLRKSLAMGVLQISRKRPRKIGLRT